jgi:hypothetical protein
MSRSSQLGRRYTVAACTSAGATVTHERVWKTCEPSCEAREAKSFIIPVVHSPPGAMGHVAAPELPSQEGTTLSCGTHGSPGAPLSGKQNLEPWDMWQPQSSPLRKVEP